MGRALAVLVAAFVIGIVLLGVASRPPVLAGSAVGTTTTTTTGPPAAGGATTTSTTGATTTTRPGTHGSNGATTTTTTVPAAARAGVKVLVANGTKVAGAAAHYSQALSAQGWTTPTPTNTTTPVAASAVYYAAGDQAQATTIAGVLGIAATSVAPLTTAVPVPGTTGMAVVVIVGADLAGRVG
jgi:hypothetical protein